MPARTFHRFPDLPYDLRHLIWEASCFKRHEKRHGIHYIDCDGWRHYSKRIKCHPASESKTSACLMDAGLWATCRESRRVIERRMRQHGLLTNDAENEVLCLKGPEPATLLIDQHKDIVCFRISDWYEEPHWGSGFHFYLSYADSTEEGFPHKVAFEIDGIWDYQHPLWRKMQRDTTSGYNPEDDDYYPFLHISIMDKNIHWFRDHNTVDDTYADSDNEFTVVKWGNLCPCNQRGMWSGALAFLMYIDWGFRHPIDEVRLYAAKVGILVRRDNEVMPCQSCQAGAKSDRPLDHLLDNMDLPTTEGDENVEESSEEEQEHARQ